MLEWTPEAIEAEQAYRRELAYHRELAEMRDGLGALGRPVPLVPWWRIRRSKEKNRRARS